MSGSTRTILLTTLLAPLLVCSPHPAPANAFQADPRRAPVSLSDDRLSLLRDAAAAWDKRPGPTRKVVDVVCLVPDVPTFLEALSTWDADHWFPILLDDVPYTSKFLRAFRPARVVRYPRRVGAFSPDKPMDAWKAALAAVLKSWAGAGAAPAIPDLGDAIHPAGAANPPGVVVSTPDSPTFAASAALAAGRFQALMRWVPPFPAEKPLSVGEMDALTLSLRKRIAEHLPAHGRLGDSCDFVTFGVDLPDRYSLPGELNALDDLVTRNPDMSRWAYCGRLIGDPTASVYRAMCSLFLQPRSALLFNGYPQAGQPWSDYDQAAASLKLGRLMPVSKRSREAARIEGWHEGFGSTNTHGLILQNSSGGENYFSVYEGAGQTADVPPGVPSVVLPIHSFSAASPGDPATIAGRWLLHGAFLYFGSMNEPYLDAFRTPTLIADLLVRRLPISAAVREIPGEVRGHPWRLTFLGDPLYRLDPEASKRPRLPDWGPIAGWPTYAETATPKPGAAGDVRFAWALQTAIARAFQPRLKGPGRAVDDWLDQIATLDRGQIPADRRRTLDELTIEAMHEAGRPAEVLSRISLIPREERSSWTRAMLEWSWAHQLIAAIGSKDLSRAMLLWDEIMRSDGARNLKEQSTERIRGLARGGSGPTQWRVQLRATIRAMGASPDVEVARKELKELEDSNPGARAARR
jgi:hypothetical protein